ncbi:hypothetical protein D8B24_20820, partial [Verminephrobacter aporrectodeae subsp. tuberculatae]|uniref:hypothetical protein n=1 Tax=Verminephrobacter aporrectodeae TaxID=1110389 RepID=UPI0039089F8B|nr:hypothetical protein [Verminephrobacter aporrectodeae subsp. tuberculatae]
PELTTKINAIYGTDTAAARKAILFIRTTTAIMGAGAAAKTATGVAKTAEKTAAAIGKKLDNVLDQKTLDTLLKSGGVHDIDGNPLLDLKSLTHEQKGIFGDLFGGHAVKQIVPDGQKIARTPGIGETGIDDLYKVNRKDVDFVSIEYKFVGDPKRTGSSVLGMTADGRQGSERWIRGSDRLKRSVGYQNAIAVENAINNSRFESWVITTRPNGSTEIQVLDSFGKPKPTSSSKLLSIQNSISGAQP